jgi:glycosyltransferase involved in cell wall biosynthesis
MISLDTSLATRPEGNSRQRHLAYAERAGRLSIVVYTPPGVGGTIYPSDTLAIFPTNSRSRLTFVRDAILQANRAALAYPVDLIAAQDPFLTGLIGVWLRRRRVPLLVQNHSYIFGNQAWIAEKPLRNTLLTELARFVVKRADMYRTVNRKERQNYLSMGGSRRRSIALPLGTASAHFAERVDERALAELRARLGLLPIHKVVLWVGYPVAFKRVPLLLKVFRRVTDAEPNAQLLLVGDMTCSPQDLRALAREEGVADRVIMHGPVPHDDLPIYYALGDVYAHTSAYEGVPRVLFEASAAGLPLVAMSAVGVDEVIAEGENGYLAPDMDIDGMAGRIISLLRNPAQAQKMGAKARERAFERYDAEGYVEKWVSVWEKAVELGMRTSKVKSRRKGEDKGESE